MSPFSKKYLPTYIAWLRKEIARVLAGGTPPPWLTREQEVERLQRELAGAERCLEKGGEA